MHSSEGKDFPIGGGTDLVIRYYARMQMSEFKILPEGLIEICVKNSLKLIDEYVAEKKLDVGNTYFDPEAPGVEGGKFHCPDDFSEEGIGIRFINSDRYGKSSIAGAKIVLDGMSRAADIGYIETARIVIYKQTGRILAAGYGLVDLVATFRNEEPEWPQTS